jgi:hypothetical protein
MQIRNGKETIYNGLIVTGGVTGSLSGTASYAEAGVSGSGAGFPFVGVADITGSLIVTNGEVVGLVSMTSNENTVIVGVPSAGGTGEGGQILLAASGGLYTSASMLDTYQDKFRVLKGTNSTSDTEHLSVNLNTGQLKLNNYTDISSFPGTLTATLGVDSSGNVITFTSGSVISSSYSVSSSNSENAMTASFLLGSIATASYALFAVTASYMLNPTMIRRSDFTQSYAYCGIAQTGSAESSPVWTITRIFVSSSGQSDSKYANNASWTNRYSTIYS